jgi:hypothetical protein
MLPSALSLAVPRPTTARLLLILVSAAERHGMRRHELLLHILPCRTASHAALNAVPSRRSLSRAPILPSTISLTVPRRTTARLVLILVPAAERHGMQRPELLLHILPCRTASHTALNAVPSRTQSAGAHQVRAAVRFVLHSGTSARFGRLAGLHHQHRGTPNPAFQRTRCARR